MARLKITQLRSEIGSKDNQRQTLRSLGLKRVRDVAAPLPVVRENGRTKTLGTSTSHERGL